MTIKFDKMLGSIRESDSDNNLTDSLKLNYDTAFNNIDKLKVNPIATDDFSADYGNYTIPSYGTGVFSFSNGKLLVKTTDVKVNTALIQSNCVTSRNLILQATVNGIYNAPQLRIRESDSQNQVYAYISGPDNLAKIKVLYNGTTYTYTSASVIPNYNASNTYKMILKVFENVAVLDIMCNGSVISSVSATSTYLNYLYGFWNGVGAVLSSGNEVFDDFSYANIDEYVNIIALGNSLTAGVMIIDAKDIYTNLLKTEYKDYPISFLNKGVGGDTALNMTARLQADVLSNICSRAKSNIVLLMAGTCEITQGTDINVAYANIMTLIQAMQKFGFQVWLITNPPRDDDSVKRTNTKLLNNLLKASTIPNKIIDFYSHCVDSNDVTLTGYLASDNEHLTATSDAVLANLIKDEINSKFKIVN